MMERIFGAQHFQTLLLSLDDVIVFSSTVDEHHDTMLSCLQQKWKMKLEKCCFFQAEVNYLGHVTSKEGVVTDLEKISAVAEWSRSRESSLCQQSPDPVRKEDA